jgi:hypothetical protein
MYVSVFKLMLIVIKLPKFRCVLGLCVCTNSKYIHKGIHTSVGTSSPDEGIMFCDGIPLVRKRKMAAGEPLPLQILVKEPTPRYRFIH